MPLVYQVPLAETVAISEADVALYKARPTVSETVTLAEAFVARMKRVIAPTETVTISEAAATVYKAKPSLAETVFGPTEALAAVFGLLVDLSESANPLSEAVAVIRTVKPAPSETVTVSESLASRLTAKPGPVETVNLVELLTPVIKYKPALAETVGLAESTLQLLHILALTGAPAAIKWFVNQSLQGKLVNVKSVRQPDGTLPYDRQYNLESPDRTATLTHPFLDYTDIQTEENRITAYPSAVCQYNTNDARVVKGYPTQIRYRNIEGTSKYEATLEVLIPHPVPA